jgi:ORF6N domain
MEEKQLIPPEIIETKIFLIRGKKVMLDRDLALLYGVETRVLNQAVQRNIKRFPNDFMFALTREEIRNISQIVISSKIKHAPNVRAFTEQGVAMLSGILNSDRAIDVNIAIMRVFVRIRELLAGRKELNVKLKELEDRIQDHDEKIIAIFEAIRQLMIPPETPKRKIGFHLKEKQAGYGRK